MQRLSLVVAIEDHFKICFDPEDEEEIDTISQVVDLIVRKLSESETSVNPLPETVVHAASRRGFGDSQDGIRFLDRHNRALFRLDPLAQRAQWQPATYTPRVKRHDRVALILPPARVHRCMAGLPTTGRRSRGSISARSAGSIG